MDDLLNNLHHLINKQNNGAGGGHWFKEVNSTLSVHLVWIVGLRLAGKKFSSEKSGNFTVSQMSGNRDVVSTVFSMCRSDCKQTLLALGLLNDVFYIRLAEGVNNISNNCWLLKTNMLSIDRLQCSAQKLWNKRNLKLTTKYCLTIALTSLMTWCIVDQITAAYGWIMVKYYDY